jgi:uncharacterized heparinase superfamily protein
MPATALTGRDISTDWTKIQMNPATRPPRCLDVQAATAMSARNVCRNVRMITPMTDAIPLNKAAMARLAAGRVRRSAVNVLMQTPLYRLRLKGPRATEILFVPPDLRTTDPTFVTEFEHGQMGLAGYVADLSGRSPFEMPPPHALWEERLHSFSWLRHMRAARDEGGDTIAKRLVGEWIVRHRSPRGRAFEAPIVARRIICWLCSAGVLLEDAEAQAYSAFLRSLDMQLTHLASTYGQSGAGLQRLNCLMALVYAGLCIADQERLLEMHEPAFLAELDRQILPNGAHVTRSSAGLVDLLLDLLPVAQCYVARDRPVPERIQLAIKRIFPWLRYMRMGDGQLARFHGSGTPATVNLATVLPYDDIMRKLPATADLGYLRGEANRTLLLMDAGPPPSMEHASEAHAGCLSFELSSGTQLLIINCGVPTAKGHEMRRLARSTAAHSTLAIEGASSSQLVTSKLLSAQPGAEGLSGPATVTGRWNKLADGAIDIEATHDGYLSRFGVVHTRTLRLSADGRMLDGRDRLGHPDPNGRIKGDIPFGIHFHLHPGVDARAGEIHNSAELALMNGETWRLMVRGNAQLVFEDSMHLSDTTGPKRSLQVVLRGRCLDSTEVHWRLERMEVVASRVSSTQASASMPKE